jgi:DNA-binding NtrC family response regulator
MKLAYLVDASASYRDLIQNHLQQLGFEVRSFVSAADCLRSVEKKPDLILLSQQLKGNEKGIDYLRQFQNQIKNVPVVMLSNEGDVYTGVEALKMGALDYIEKNGALLVRLRTAIDNIPDFIKRQNKRKLLRGIAMAAALAFLTILIFIWLRK